MKQAYKLMTAFVLLTLPFCGSKRSEKEPLCISSAEISLQVRADDLRVALDKRLDALAYEIKAKEKKTRHTRNLEAVTAHEVIKQ